MIVVGVDRDRVKLGFNAPDDIDICREELGSLSRPHNPHEKTEGMLVLTRKIQGEGVFIGNDVFVKVLGANRGRVKVGINAPDDVKIKRGELLDESRRHGSKERF